MFGFGKKKVLQEDKILYAPLAGEVIELEKVSDPVFAKKVMGEGYAIKPTSNQLYAPVSARVSLIQGHAIGFTRADGLEVLLHIGIDTVSLNGDPFHFKVKVGEIVDGGQELGDVDWSIVEAAGLEKTSMVIFTNTADCLNSFDVNYGTADAGSKLGAASVK